MTIPHLWPLTIIQSITEAFPISSSGHLVLCSRLLGWKDIPDALEAALHVGSFLALLLYFWRQALDLLGGLCDIVRLRVHTQRAHTLLCLGVATVPSVLVGALIHAYDWHLHGAYLIAINSIFFGFVLYKADSLVSHKNSAPSMSDAWLIGCAQVLAFFPGVSRLGICLTAGCFLRYSRVDAAQFSFLMGLASIFGALVLKRNLLLSLPLTTLMGVAILSVAITLPLVAFFMYWIKRHTLRPFAVYRIALGIVMLGVMLLLG